MSSVCLLILYFKVRLFNTDFGIWSFSFSLVWKISMVKMYHYINTCYGRSLCSFYLRVGNAFPKGHFLKGTNYTKE
ncbi:MAG: hypothetical protein K0R31_1184 [Clostridiales bacterium]|nr:hypothetical protein [Clostridiales bacterium]